MTQKQAVTSSAAEHGKEGRVSHGDQELAEPSKASDNDVATYRITIECIKEASSVHRTKCVDFHPGCRHLSMSLGKDLDPR